MNNQKGVKEISRTYSQQFREEALKLSDEIGMKKTVAQLGIPYYTLATWRNNRSAKKRAGMEKARFAIEEIDSRIHWYTFWEQIKVRYNIPWHKRLKYHIRAALNSR